MYFTALFSDNDT